MEMLDLDPTEQVVRSMKLQLAGASQTHISPQFPVTLIPSGILILEFYTFRENDFWCLVCWLQLNDSEVRKDSGKPLNQYVKIRIQIKLLEILSNCVIEELVRINT